METHGMPPLDPQKGEWDADALSRRRFLETGVWALTGVAGLGVAGVSVRYLAGKAFVPRPSIWVQVGPVAELTPGQVHRANYSLRTSDVWRKAEQKGVVYAYSEDGATYSVLDATCSHLGCVVHWQETEQHFACPCHTGHFQRDGAVIDGPPPLPLRQLATKIEDGVLFAEI